MLGADFLYSVDGEVIHYRDLVAVSRRQFRSEEACFDALGNPMASIAGCAIYGRSTNRFYIFDLSSFENMPLLTGVANVSSGMVPDYELLMHIFVKTWEFYEKRV